MSTKQHILIHAESLARRRGYDGFSFADLAEGAGIRKASVHHHFPTKAVLSVELMEAYANRFMAALNRVSDKNAGQRLAAMIAQYRNALEGGQSQCLCVAFSAISERLPESTKAAVHMFQDSARGWLEQVFSDALKDGSIRDVSRPDEEAAAAFALLEGAQLVSRTSRDPSQFELTTAPLRRRIQTGD